MDYGSLCAINELRLAGANPNDDAKNVSATAAPRVAYLCSAASPVFGACFVCSLERVNKCMTRAFFAAFSAGQHLTWTHSDTYGEHTCGKTMHMPQHESHCRMTF